MARENWGLRARRRTADRPEIGNHGFAPRGVEGRLHGLEGALQDRGQAQAFPAQL